MKFATERFSFSSPEYLFVVYLYMFLFVQETSYAQVADSLKQGHQVMVFVHSRKDTGKTADKLVTSFLIY